MQKHFMKFKILIIEIVDIIIHNLDSVVPTMSKF